MPQSPELKTRYREFKHEIALALKPRGFQTIRETFLVKSGNNQAFINIQRSTSSDANHIKLTFNLGVCCDIIWRCFRVYKAPPTIHDYHWHQRIGHMLPVHNDTWWTIKSDTDAMQLGRDIAGQLETHVLPTMIRYLDPTELRDLWLSDRLKLKAAGQTMGFDLTRLAALLTIIGPSDQLVAIQYEVLEECRNASERRLAESNLQKIDQFAREESGSGGRGSR